MPIQRLSSLLTSLLVLAPATLRADMPFLLNKCTDINASGVYKLDRDLMGSTGQACMRIHDAADVELDCQDHSITTDSGLAAVVVQTVKNFTLKSCSLPQLEGYSLIVGNSSKGLITQNVIRDMVVYNPEDTDLTDLRVIGNHFSEFKQLHLETPRPRDNPNKTVIPLAAGFNKIEARAMVDADLSSPQNPQPETTAAAQPQLTPRVYPNPWRAERHSEMTFDQLPQEGSLNVYTVAAHWVITLPVVNGRVRWDLRDPTGNPIASGVYFYLVKTPTGGKAVGKFVVIR